MTDQEAIQKDTEARAKWEKEHPAKPYRSHLTPKQQSIQDAEQQELTRQRKQDQATQNNEDRQRVLDNATNAEADAQTKATNELEAADAKAPATKAAPLDRRHRDSLDTRALPRVERRHGAPDLRK